jgi:hypothetical protein
MMAKVIVFCAAMVATLPILAFGQTKTDAVASTPCCGQAVIAKESPEQLKSETQQNLQVLLLMTTGAKRLPPGDYFITESAEGFEFRALVSRQGIVDGWYFAEADGTPVALINARSNNGPVGGGRTTADCFVKYSRDVSVCAYLENAWPNRYSLCLNNAWNQLFNCLRSFGSGGSGVMIW